MKHLYILFLFLLANSTLFGQYILKIWTGKKIYQYKEPIYINLSIENLSSLWPDLEIKSTCQVRYEIIGVYNWLNDHTCRDTLEYVPLGSDESHYWQFLYSNWALPVGYYKIVGEVVGYGKSDTSEFKIIDTLSTKYVASYSAILKDSTQGYPLSNILVAIDGLDSTYSDLKGRFLFDFPESVFSDSVTIHPLFKFQSPYTKEYYKRITISKGDNITGPDIMLPYQFISLTVTGHIGYGNKESKPGVSIFFYGINVNNGGLFNPDSNGNYSVKLIPGSYYVHCGINYDINGYRTVRDKYYNNTSDFNKKEILAISNNTSGIDFTFPSLQMGTISGNVSDSLSKLPINNAVLVVTPVGLPVIDTAWAFSDQNGNYSIQVVEDNYIMSAFRENYYPEFYNGKVTYYYFNFWYSQPEIVDTIVVDANHLNYSGINFHLIPSNYDVGGFIKDRSSDKTIPGVKTYLISAEHGPWGPSISDTAGRYGLGTGGWNGEYFVLYNKDGYIDKYYDSDQWEDAASFNLNGSNQLPFEADVYLTPTDTSGGKISGKILSGSDSLLSYALVSAINSSDSVVSASISKDDGSYIINSLPDGEYIIRASKVGYSTTQYPDKIKIDTKSQSDVNGINVVVNTTGIKDKENTVPASYRLFQNYPNPFNPTTTIRYELPEESNVQIVIYNILGKKVKELVNKLQMPGRYEVNWDANTFASGVYFCTIEVGNFRDAKKLVLIK